MPVRRILATTREIGAAMFLRIPNPESRIPVVQKIPHSVPQSLPAGFEMRLRPPFGPRHVAARPGAVTQPGRRVEHVTHLFGVVLPVGGQVQTAVVGEFLPQPRGQAGTEQSELVVAHSKIGRGPCRSRGGEYVYIPVV